MVPWAVHDDFSEGDESNIVKFLDQMIKDLVCFNFVHVSRSDRASTDYPNGILFVPGELTGGGCWSALGKSPGFANLPEYNAKSTWQVISLHNSACGGAKRAEFKINFYQR